MTHTPEHSAVTEPKLSLGEKLAPRAWQALRDEFHGFILRPVGDPTAAEDLVQEVLLKAYARRQTLRQASRLRPWLYQIARNVLVDYYRKRQSSPALSAEAIAWTIEDEDNSTLRDLARCLVPLLDELPEPYRRVLQLTEFEGLTQRELASRLGLSLSGAKSRVQRARVMLREVLLKCCRVELDRLGGVVDYESREACDDCDPPIGT